jgi:adenosine deaminase
LEGSIRLQALWHFNRDNKPIQFPSPEAMKKAVQIPKGQYPGFSAFLNCFPPLRFPYGKIDALKRVARECVEDAANDGIAHLEIRFSPVFWARRVIGVTEPLPTVDECERASEAIISSSREMAAKRGVTLAFICSLGRHFGADGNLPATELLKRPIAKDFSAVDVAGDEKIPLSTLDKQLKAWRDAGKQLTLHAGECTDEYGGLGACSVREAVEVYGATRIGHGIRAHEDSAVVALLVEKKVALEICITSNVQTRSVVSYKQHPLGKLLRAGVNVTLNSDDPVVSDCTLSEDYYFAQNYCGLSKAELQRVAVNTVKAAYLDESQKAKLVERVNAAF